MASVLGFYHGGVTVRDMDIALSFYRDGLGLEVEFDRRLGAPYLRQILNLEFDHLRAVSLRIPNGGSIELLEYVGIERQPAASRPCDYGAGHLCLFVDGVRDIHDRLVGLGFESRGGYVVEVTEGPNLGARTCYMRDPDGYSVELLERPATT